MDENTTPEPRHVTAEWQDVLYSILHGISIMNEDPRPRDQRIKQENEELPEKIEHLVLFVGETIRDTLNDLQTAFVMQASTFGSVALVILHEICAQGIESLREAEIEQAVERTYTALFEGDNPEIQFTILNAPTPEPLELKHELRKAWLARRDKLYSLARTSTAEVTKADTAPIREVQDRAAVRKALREAERAKGSGGVH